MVPGNYDVTLCHKKTVKSSIEKVTIEIEKVEKTQRRKRKGKMEKEFMQSKWTKETPLPCLLLPQTLCISSHLLYMFLTSSLFR